jgi:hypothetical protein
MSVAANNDQLTRRRQKPRLWWLMLVLSVLIAIYGMSYVVLGERMFNGEIGDSFRARPWGIFTHALFASIALAIGPLQFHRGLLVRYRAVHRTLGKIYVISAIIGSGILGLYMAIYSFGGWITHVGFGLLAVLTTLTTGFAYLKIRQGEVVPHREWMIRSFALIFAAVTLRLWLPLLILIHKGDFTPAYLWVSWICWVPNLLLAEVYIARSSQHQRKIAQVLFQSRSDK